MASEFYERPLVRRLENIFGHPKKPSKVVQKQFDYAQDELVRIAAKAWHEIDPGDYWAYLLDLCYVELQQDLFNYLFPAFLIKWWEGQVNRMGGPESECDFYRAINKGRVLDKMMDATRRDQVLAWMVDAYMDGIDAWSGNLRVTYRGELQPDDLHGPLWSFNALGEIAPITGPILSHLNTISTEGRAQWWLVIASGLIWEESECPYVPAWTQNGGGGGIYMTGSAAWGLDGYLPENLDALANEMKYHQVLHRLEQCSKVLENSSHREWCDETLVAWQADPNRMTKRIETMLTMFGLEDLGGPLSSLKD